MIKNKKTIFLILLALVILGFLGFWYYRDKVFSKEILRFEILGSETTKAGDEISYTVKYKNNGNFVLENPKLIFELPANSLTEDSKTRLTKNLKDIYPGEEDFTQFKGRLLGKEGDLKVAHAWLSYTPKNLSARYESDTTFTTKIETVPVTLSFDLPQKVEEGKEISYAINYSSNIDYPLENLSIKMDAVSGFNVKSSSPASLDNIEWKLATLQKDQGGKITINGMFASNTPSLVTFTAHFGMWQDGAFLIIKDANYDVAISNSLQDTPVVVEQKPSSHITISQKAYHASDSNFENSGPIPPEVGKPTSYEIIWQISNDLHDVKEVRVSAILPANVTLAAIAPESEIPNIVLDPASHQIVWTVLNVPAGAGISVPAPLVSFQITLTPDVLMRGSAASLIGAATVAGQDTVTETTVTGSASAVDTTLPDDQGNSGGGIVK